MWPDSFCPQQFEVSVSGSSFVWTISLTFNMVGQNSLHYH